MFYIYTFVMISLADSNNICNPRVAMTDANTTMPCQNNLHALNKGGNFILMKSPK